MANIATPGSLAVAAAVTPAVAALPLPVTKHTFNPPTVTESVAGVGSLWGRWGRLTRGISVLKFGNRYVQYRMPTEDDVAAADRAYIGGRVYDVDDTEAAALTAAGYLVTDSVVPYTPPMPGGFGGVRLEPMPPLALTLSVGPATGSAGAVVPTVTVNGNTQQPNTGAGVRVPGALASAVAVPPTVTGPMNRAAPAISATAAAVIPAVTTGVSVSGVYTASYPATY